MLRQAKQKRDRIRVMSTSKNHSTTKPETQPLLNSPLAKKRGRLLYKVFLIFLVIIGVLIGKILYERQGYSYKSELNNALADITNVAQGKVSVSTSQTGIDAEVETIFIARENKPQKKLVRLDYLQSAGTDSDDVRLLDVFKVPFAELPLNNERFWVTVRTKKDINSLESLGFPVETLLNENSNTPLLPFGNFAKDQRHKINPLIRQAFADAEFIRADNGKLEFQANITEDEASDIVAATSDTTEPMDTSVIDKLYADHNDVILTVKVDRKTGKLAEMQMATKINDRELTAVYEFDYSPVKLPAKPAKSITAEQFVDRYLKNLKNQK